MAKIVRSRKVLESREGGAWNERGHVHRKCGPLSGDIFHRASDKSAADGDAIEAMERICCEVSEIQQGAQTIQRNSASLELPLHLPSQHPISTTISADSGRSRNFASNKLYQTLAVYADGYGRLLGLHVCCLSGLNACYSYHISVLPKMTMVVPIRLPALSADTSFA